MDGDGKLERWTHQLFNMRTSKGTSAYVPGTKYPLERMKKSFALAEIIGTFSWQAKPQGSSFSRYEIRVIKQRCFDSVIVGCIGGLTFMKTPRSDRPLRLSKSKESARFL